MPDPARSVQEDFLKEGAYELRMRTSWLKKGKGRRKNTPNVCREGTQEFREIAYSPVRSLKRKKSKHEGHVPHTPFQVVILIPKIFIPTDRNSFSTNLRAEKKRNSCRTCSS